MSRVGASNAGRTAAHRKLNTPEQTVTAQAAASASRTRAACGIGATAP
jgi:hypothetical protein